MAAACDGGHGTPTSPGVPAYVPGTQPLSAEALAATNDAIQDEYRAEAIYTRVLIDFGAGTQPFATVVDAEARHVESLARIYQDRGLTVPASTWNVDNAPTFDSVLEACRASAGTERANIALYDRYLKLDLPLDARNVFTNNRDASLLNHLPAFETCILTAGG